MRAFEDDEIQAEELTPQESRMFTVIAMVVGFGFICLLVGLVCLIIAFSKCNCNAV